MVQKVEAHAMPTKVSDLMRKCEPTDMFRTKELYLCVSPQFGHYLAALLSHRWLRICDCAELRFESWCEWRFGYRQGDHP